MIWRPSTKVVLVLASFVQLGVVSTPLARSASTKTNRVTSWCGRETSTTMPFTIDANEVESAVRVYTGEQFFPATASGTITLNVGDGCYNVVDVLNASNGIIAKDVVHPAVKMSLEFNAANSARAQVFDALMLTVLPYAKLGELYNQIDQQKKFPELVAAYKQDKRIRSDVASFRLAILIAERPATAYLD